MKFLRPERRKKVNLDGQKKQIFVCKNRKGQQIYHRREPGKKVRTIGRLVFSQFFRQVSHHSKFQLPPRRAPKHLFVWNPHVQAKVDMNRVPIRKALGAAWHKLRGNNGRIRAWQRAEMVHQWRQGFDFRASARIGIARNLSRGTSKRYAL